MMSVKRRLFTICAAISLVLCLVAMGLWIRSYWREDCWLLHSWPFGGSVDSSRGAVSVSWWTPRSTWAATQRAWTFAGFGLYRDTLILTAVSYHGPTRVWTVINGSFPEGTTLQVPHWALAVPGMILPLLWWRRRHRTQRRRALGLCLTCGYDLRASSERCSECGTPIPADLVRRPMT